MSLKTTGRPPELPSTGRRRGTVSTALTSVSGAHPCTQNLTGSSSYSPRLVTRREAPATGQLSAFLRAEPTGVWVSSEKTSNHLCSTSSRGSGTAEPHLPTTPPADQCAVSVDSASCSCVETVSGLRAFHTAFFAFSYPYVAASASLSGFFGEDGAHSVGWR